MQYDSKLQSLVDNGYTFNMNYYFNQGMNLFKKFMGPYVGYTALYFAIVFFASIIPMIGGLVSLFIQPILIAGFYIVANDLMREMPIDFSRFFKGFEFYIQLIAANLIVSIFVVLGIFALIIPGIYFAVAYTFTPLFILFLGYDFWAAMEWSRKIVTKNFWPILGFVIIIGLINIAGALFCFVGLLFTLPATSCMIYSAFEDVVGGAIRNPKE
ncbi:MAG: hypothetical protein PHF99_06870 [Bacteroidales bacterium]|jgi:uncharacterized membrane protein|nr:hypothetical protein [Bacteroidales bacterium]MDY0160576.1 hypothetical protein [Bacteroidales bacterium]